MTLSLNRPRLFRARDESEGQDRVTFIELFFDLVFVFAITQLSHTIVDHLDVRGLAEAAVILVAVWWVWMYTAWATNWLDPETGPVRLMLFVLMLLGLVLSTSIPGAFGDRALGFAIAYVVMQVGRTTFLAWCYRAVDRANGMNITRITIWFLVTAPLWILGAVLGGDAQLVLWATAILVEVLGPSARYYTPFLGASPTSSWSVSGGHIAERSGLFIILALGESILVTGTAFSQGDLSLAAVSGVLAAFVSTILFWLLYFSHGAEHGSRFIRSSELTGPIARLTYVYLHIPIVAGVVLSAVGDELVLVHPEDPPSAAGLAVVVGAPALYLIGNLLFKRSIGRPWLRSHLAGIAVLAAAYLAAATVLPPVDGLALLWLTNAVVALVVIADEVSTRRAGSSPVANPPAAGSLTE